MRIKPSDLRAYLLTMLDQPAFKAVELLKLSEFLSFDDFMIKRFVQVRRGRITSYSLSIQSGVGQRSVNSRSGSE